MTRRRVGPRSRRLVINVCSQETGRVRLPVEVGLPAVLMDARAVRHHLDELVQARGLSDRVRIRDACAGGCGSGGPNISVSIYPTPVPPNPPMPSPSPGKPTSTPSLR